MIRGEPIEIVLERGGQPLPHVEPEVRRLRVANEIKIGDIGTVDELAAIESGMNEFPAHFRGVLMRVLKIYPPSPALNEPSLVLGRVVTTDQHRAESSHLWSGVPASWFHRVEESDV